MMTGGRPLLRALTRLLAVVPLLAAFSVIGSATKVGPSVAGCAQAATLHHAALVVEHGNGAVIRVCVSFAADSITGDEVLAGSGIPYATADYGGTGKAVCQIDGEPGQYPPGCWTASSPYWAMFVSRAGGSWVTSSLGISSQTFRDGDAEGFRYEGQSASSVPPSPAGVCPAPSSPTPAPGGTPTPVPRATSTGAPRSTGSQPPHAPPAAATPASSLPGAEPSTQSPSSAVSTSASPRAAIAPGRRTPPAQPPFLNAGAWAASALGAVLLVTLMVRVIRLERHRAPPRGLP